jgi:hypothetical protein
MRASSESDEQDIHQFNPTVRTAGKLNASDQVTAGKTLKFISQGTRNNLAAGPLWSLGEAKWIGLICVLGGLHVRQF